MTGDVQPPDPPAELLRVASEVTTGWMRRVLSAAIAAAGDDPGRWRTDIDRVASAESGTALAALAELLAIDVDEQRTTPLSVYRASTAGATAWLRSIGVTPRGATSAPVASADDPFHLGPATWSDIDPALHEPGLAWGAWKAMTVLRRRRDEGLR